MPRLKLHSDFAEYKATKFLSTKTKEDHLGLLDGYLKNCNKLLPDYSHVVKEKVNPNSSETRTVVEQFNHNYNAVILHSLYFSQIASTKQTVPDEFLKWNQHSSFKSFKTWRQRFTEIALASRGWVVYGFDPFLDSDSIIAIDGHDKGLPPAFLPALVLDVWEHAYVGDFGTDRAKYIEEWFDYINWSVLQTYQDTLLVEPESNLFKVFTASIATKRKLLGLGDA